MIRAQDFSTDGAFADAQSPIVSYEVCLSRRAPVACGAAARWRAAGTNTSLALLLDAPLLAELDAAQREAAATADGGGGGGGGGADGGGGGAANGTALVEVLALVRATNAAGRATEAASNALTVDVTPPAAPRLWVEGFGEGADAPCVLNRTTDVGLRWAASPDDESGLAAFELRVELLDDGGAAAASGTLLVTRSLGAAARSRGRTRPMTKTPLGAGKPASYRPRGRKHNSGRFTEGARSMTHRGMLHACHGARAADTPARVDARSAAIPTSHCICAHAW